MRKIHLKIVDIDDGFCRITFKAQSESGASVYYCLQDEGERYGGVILYRSTSEYEPEYAVKNFKNGFDIAFQLPPENFELGKKCADWIRRFEEKGMIA